jgi:sulfur relay (sulfurtransferase) complex TusBCD TusD component (DsrE family)
MEPDLDQLSCMDCGTPIDADQAVAQRTFALTDEVVLCNACALRRGGVYDDAADKWKLAPRLEDTHAIG